MPTQKSTARLSKKPPLSPEELKQIDAYWRAANYLTACQLYLLDNPLLERPLCESDLKQTIVGHWGTCPGQNFIYTHLNRVSNEYDLFLAVAQTEAKKLMVNASKNATLEEQKRIEQAQEQIAGLVVEATAKLVAAKQNADSDRELYNQFIAKTGEKID